MEKGKSRITAALLIFLGSAWFFGVSSVQAQSDGGAPSAPSRLVPQFHGSFGYDLNHYQAFAACLDRNPESERTRVAQAFGYRRQEGFYVFDRSLALDPSLLVAGDLYLPTIKELASLLNPDGVSSRSRFGFEPTATREGMFYYNRQAYPSSPWYVSPVHRSHRFFWSSSISLDLERDALIFEEYGAYILSTGRGRADRAVTTRCVRLQSVN